MGCGPLTRRLRRSAGIGVPRGTFHHFTRQSHIRPLRGFATRGEANTPSASECRAAAGAGVLRLEHGVSAHRRLLPVVRRVRRCEPHSDEVLAMGANRLNSLLCDILPVRFREMEATTELRLRKPGECGIVCACVHDSQWLSRLRRVRHSGSLASMNAWNLGPCPCAFRWVNSWTTTYSTSSRGIPASISE